MDKKDSHEWSLTLSGVNYDQFLGVLHQILSANGLSILRSSHLSDIHVDRGVWEFIVVGPVSGCAKYVQDAIRKRLNGGDCWLQLNTAERSRPGLAVFDMDSTLIEVEVIDELAKVAGIGDKVSTITEKCMRGELDFTSSFVQRLGLLRGVQAASLIQIAETLPVMPGAQRVFNYFKAIGCKTALVSGGFTCFATAVQDALGIDIVCANELAIEAGEVTGEPVFPIVDAQRKCDELLRLAEQWGVSLDNTIAVGDGANDLKMINAAGRGVAFKAKPVVQEQADYAINSGGLDYLLYLMGVSDTDYTHLVSSNR